MARCASAVGGDGEIHMARVEEEALGSAVSILRNPDPVTSAYSVLEEAVTRYQLEDAWLVLHPAGLSTQVFRHSRRPGDGADIRRVAARPTGLYGDPAIVPTTGALLGACCEAAFVSRLAADGALTDRHTTLLSRPAIDASLTRVAANAARHRWSTTAVLVTTTGPGERERWPALAQALQQALRGGDEAGVAAPGTALALLGDAGPDAVRPFLARVRAALSAAGWDGAEVLAASATTPQESVDPAELWRLVTERLVEVGAEPLEVPPAPALELELRLLPAVAYVGAQQSGSGQELTVVRLGDAGGPSVDGTQAPGADIEAAVRRHDPDLTVRVVTAVSQPIPSPTALEARPLMVAAAAVYANGATSNGANGSHATDSAPVAVSAMHADSAEAAVSATAHSAGLTPVHGSDDGPEAPPRVVLMDASFDPARGISEVSLALGAARGTGRAPAGALVGGAQATLVALGTFGQPVPFYLVSAERARTIPGEPVVAVLAPRGAAGDASGRRLPPGERIGVAGGASDVEAASKAVLSALNRFLAEPSIKA